MIENLEVNIQKGKIEISIQPAKANRFVLAVLSILVIVSFIFPLVAIFLAVLFVEQLNIGFGYILTLIIFWGTGIYFLRKLLWNLRGKEVFTLTEDEVMHFFDYGFFKDKLSTFESRSPKFGYSWLENPDDIYLISDEDSFNEVSCYLAVVTDREEIIRSHFPITLDQLEKLLNLSPGDD